MPAILCRGETTPVLQWLQHAQSGKSLLRCLAIIVAGCMAYGFTLGIWRAPLMACFVAVKLPLLILLTVLANGVLNGLFAQILGTGLGFRQTLHTILISFTTFSIIVGALSPVTLFMALNTPEYGGTESTRWHGFTLLIHTLLIAYAGILANMKMLRLLTVFSGDPRAATRTFLAWTAGNLFLGAQMAWVFRPWFGSPGLDVQFLRPDPLRGNFYEAVFTATKNVAGVGAPALLLLGAIILTMATIIFFQVAAQRNRAK